MVVTAPSSAASFVSLDDVYVPRDRGGGFALRGLTLHLAAGSLTPLLGPAGSGKTTLLRVLAGLEGASAGTVVVDGADPTDAGDENAPVRAGFVPSPPLAGLLPDLDANSNLAMALHLGGGARNARRRLQELRELLDLTDVARSRVDRLAAFALTRLAIACALAGEPRLLLLDEPAAGLEESERDELLELLRRVHAELELTTLVATRDPSFAYRIGSVVRLREGRAVTERVRQSAFSRGEGERTTELALLDSDGRIEIPPEQRAALGIDQRARVTLEDDHVAVWPERPPPDPNPPWRRRS